jgi:NCAIR mutase (PurE)-related protein
MTILKLQEIRDTLAAIESGELSAEEAAKRLEGMTFVDLGESMPDVHREARTGQPEVIFGPGKAPMQVAGIVKELLEAAVRPVIVSRATSDQFRAILDVAPGAVHHAKVELVVVGPRAQTAGRIAVVSAGTSDQRVAEEVALVAEALGVAVERVADVGVAGVHRVLAFAHSLEDAGCVVVVAGMEAALPSVVAGLTKAPVVAVPTSVGYGATLGGLAALLSMLAGCVPGVVVVNVDNGVGAAMAAHRILSRG